MHKHAGWRSRGYIPHCDGAQMVQHVVFGLADALPDDAALDNDSALDACAGACVLRDPTPARIAEATLLHDDGERYRLFAWCVMPNHVHVLFEQRAGHRLSDVVQAWKSVSAHRINKALDLQGPLWRREYFDRFMRDGDHFATTKRYVEMNPVAAGLCERAEDWAFSSAGWKG